MAELVGAGQITAANVTINSDGDLTESLASGVQLNVSGTVTIDGRLDTSGRGYFGGFVTYSSLELPCG